ncbi:hypothetical protein FACS1894102_6510 [Spirochaetia bacterium]|nr:hypothetical protein FACS1894102_6510 [Spirochaetia bacterium]
MATNEITAEEAENLAGRIENAAANAEETARLVTEKLGLKQTKSKPNEPGLFRTIFKFIKSYNETKPATAEEREAWLLAEYSKSEYESLWAEHKDEEKDIKKVIEKTAKGICESIDDYETAKKDLELHLAEDGTQESWLAAQVEIGAYANGVDAQEYAKQVKEGLEAAVKENMELLQNNGAEGGTK